jgi:hypothetical protein
MKDIRNATLRPLRVPLPHGKVLHLGPHNTGQVPASALDHPPFQKLVEAGEVEVLGEGAHESRHPLKEERDTGGPAGGGRPQAGVTHSSGER